MKTYHIFAIKKNIYNTYKNKEYSLYKILFNLYNLNKEDINYGLTLYNQICYPINKKIVEEYLEFTNYRKGKNKYMISDTKNIAVLIIKPSNIIYKSNIINKDITYILNNYYKYLFICNFKEKDYKWLNNIE